MLFIINKATCLAWNEGCTLGLQNPAIHLIWRVFKRLELDFFCPHLNAESVQCIYLCGRRHALQSGKCEIGRPADIGDSESIHLIYNHPVSNSLNHFG